MLQVLEVRVDKNVQLTKTGFAALFVRAAEDVEKSNGALLEPSPVPAKSLKLVGERLDSIRPSDALVVVGKHEIDKKYGPQIRIKRWWQADHCPFDNLKAVRATLTFLYETLEISAKMAERIFDFYGPDSEASIRRDPWEMIRTVKGIRLDSVDKIAKQLGISVEKNPSRLNAVILRILGRNYSLMGAGVFQDGPDTYGAPGGGHVYMDCTQIVCHAADQIGLSRKLVKEKLLEMAVLPRRPGWDERPSLVIEKDKANKERFVYTYSLAMAERGLAKHVNRIRSAGSQSYSECPLVLPDKFTMTDEQVDAVKMALFEKISIITGGPGVGKTTIIDAITKTLSKQGLQPEHDFHLCAPTGIAARRLEQSTGHMAQTIHRLLKVDPIQGRFSHHHDNPLSSKFIICDESSMIDISLMFSLFDAIPNDAHVVLVGDVNQLPPVGPGSPFHDLLAWNSLASTRLMKIHRQELVDSLIIQGSRSVLEEKVPTFSTDPTTGDLFAFPYPQGKESQALTMITDLLLKRIPEKFSIPRESIQIISPHRAKFAATDKDQERPRYLSTENINSTIQFEIFGKKVEGSRFHEGDKVIHTKNNYKLEDTNGGKGVMNGEIGYVKQITLIGDAKAHAKYTITYGKDTDKERDVRYELEDTNELELAYALTIHRMQGQEAQAVIVLAYSAPQFYTRNMLYTAITRGKRLVVIVSPHDKKSFYRILKTPQMKRCSRLIERIESQDYGTELSENMLSLSDFDMEDEGGI